MFFMQNNPKELLVERGWLEYVFLIPVGTIAFIYLSRLADVSSF